MRQPPEKAILFVAIGNPLRGDDSVGHALAEMLAGEHGVGVCPVHQLTPEVAPCLAASTITVFLDADLSASSPQLQPVHPSATIPVSHSLSPGAVVLLARTLYSWKGQALLCRLPANSFPHGSGLSAKSASALSDALKLLSSALAVDICT